jgi:hypothetical protein
MHAGTAEVYFPYRSAPVVTILIKIPAPSFAAFVALFALSPFIEAGAAAVAPRVLKTVGSTGRLAPPSLRTVASTRPWVLRRSREHQQRDSKRHRGRTHQSN